MKLALKVILALSSLVASWSVKASSQESARVELLKRNSPLLSFGVTADQAVSRYRRSSGLDRLQRGFRSALDSANRADGSVDNLTEWSGDLAQLQSAFESMRDTRDLEWETNPGFKRRPTWLYPDEGCFSRAGVASQRMERLGFSRPGKVFAFGNLLVNTSNSLRGYVIWWFHVAPAYRFKGQVLVMDPALEPERPLPVREWLAKMSYAPDKLRVAYCDSHSYLPSDICRGGEGPGDNLVVLDQAAFFDVEFERVRKLGREPFNELGDLPPWKNKGRRGDNSRSSIWTISGPDASPLLHSPLNQPDFPQSLE